MKKNLLVWVLLLSGLTGLHAQPVRITATLDSAGYRPGDWILIQLSAEHNNDAELMWSYPVKINSLNFEKLAESAIDSIQQRDFLTENRTITVTTFDTGVLQIPPITCYFRSKGFTDSVTTSPINVYVAGIAVDTAAAPRAIKPPFSFPAPQRDVWLFLMPALSLLAIGAAGYFFYRKRMQKRNQPVHVPVDNRLPHEKAMDRIKEIERDKPWEQQSVKEFYVQLTRTLREYIELGLGVPALESTTHDLVKLLHKAGVDTALIRQLQHDLALADMVKFARAAPSIEAHHQFIATAKEFIVKTKPSVQVPVQEETIA